MDNLENFVAGTKRSNIIPVIETMPADLLTPLSVYLKVSKGSSHSFLLESVEGGESLARYSFIGANPDFTLSGNDNESTVRTVSNGTQSKDVGVFDFLRKHFESRNLASEESESLFAGGAIGYLGFRCLEWFEPSLRTPPKEDTCPDAELMFYTSVIAFDHVKQTINIVSLIFKDEASDEGELESLCEKATANNKELKRILETEPVSLPRMSRTAGSSDVRSNWSEADFKVGVEEIRKLIYAGECYQVVLSQRFSKKTNANAVGIYRAIRSLNPSPYMFLLNFGERTVVGASPEMLVRCRGRELEYRPIAGTRPRGSTPEDDRFLADEMRQDEKEVAEHLMLVDLGRNDLGRIAEYGSVTVSELMEVERYSHVQHLVSRITAKLRSSFDRFDALAACFPAGTVSGAPKVRAVQIIKELEPTERGVYSGAVGYFDYSGNMDTCIAIRTLVLENGEATVQAGAGIVADSLPEMEFRETVNKARAMLKAVELAERASINSGNRVFHK
jgi:anthranilate synthase component 1